MKKAGQIVLFRFPQTDLTAGKLRPALIISKLPGRFEDWLICMISSQLRQINKDFDEIIQESDTDFKDTGLKVSSVVRVGRLAVVEESILIGAIGEIQQTRLIRIKSRLIDWLSGE